MPDDPRWPRAGAWLAGDHLPDPVSTLAVVGAPVRLGSISGGRFDRAPAALRSALDRFGTFDAEHGVDVRAVEVRDMGDLPLAEVGPAEALDPIRDAAARALREADAFAALGGDNSITRPVCRGLPVPLERVGLLTLDAHHDLRDTDAGLTNGNPVRALLEDGLPGRNVVQIGIQPFANSPHYAAVARDAGITVITAEEVRGGGIGDAVRRGLDHLARRADAIHVDLDVDVLDRAFAPASPGSRPGGLEPWHLLRAARDCGAHPRVRSVDVVEVDPERDVADTTVLAAAAALLSFASGLAVRARAAGAP